MSESVFSIITVALNHLDGLKRTHCSLLAQDFKNFEWIVVDGGSRDGTQEYLQGAAAHWSSGPDGGIYDAMNKGLERATGGYVLFLNAGDALASTCVLRDIHAAVSGCERAPDFIYGDSMEAGRLKRARPLSRAGQGMITHHQAMLYRRAALKDLRYDLRYKIAADYDFTLRFLQAGAQQNALYLPVPFCDFETGGISQRQADAGRAEQFAIREKLKICPIWKNCCIRFAQKILWSARQICPGLYWRFKSSIIR